MYRVLLSHNDWNHDIAAVVEPFREPVFDIPISNQRYYWGLPFFGPAKGKVVAHPVACSLPHHPGSSPMRSVNEHVQVVIIGNHVTIAQPSHHRSTNHNVRNPQTSETRGHHAQKFQKFFPTTWRRVDAQPDHVVVMCPQYACTCVTRTLLRKIHEGKFLRGLFFAI